MVELTQNEKRLLTALAKERTSSAPHLAELLHATPEAVIQWAHLAMDNCAATVERTAVKEFVYSDEGKKYRELGLPETQLLVQIGPGTTMAELQKHPAFKIGFGQLRKKKLISVSEDRKSTRLNSSHSDRSRMPSSA